MHKVTGIEHLAIFSTDSEKLKNWYIDMFDFAQVYDNGKGTYFLKAQNGGMIEFIKTDKDEESVSHTAKGIRHIAISVSDFEGMVEKLKSDEVEVVTEPSVSDKGIGTFFFRDPEGNVLHLIFRPDPL